MALTSASSYLTLNAVQKLALRLRMELLDHLDRLSAHYYENTPTGTVMYSLKDPIDEVAYFGSDLLPSVLRMCVTTAFSVITMVLLSPMLTLVVLPLVPVFIATRQRFRAKLAGDSDAVQRDLLSWNRFLEEHISSMIAIQLLGQERRQERKAFRLLSHTIRSHVTLFRTGAWFTVCTSLAVVFAMSVVIGYGGWAVITGALSLGSLVAFYSFVAQLFEPLSGAAELYARAQRTFASIRQLQCVLALETNVRDSAACVPFPEKDWRVDFKDVEFGHHGRGNVLRISSLCILPGEKLAIAGENGAGKSTLARLIVRTYDVDSGSIHVGTEDVRNIRLKSLRERVCYLCRDPVLFDGSIRSNLRFVRPGASDHELYEMIQLADLTNLVGAFPQRLDQRIGPDGCQLSGGERQRLAIARALLQKPRVLILDEATSCLDPASEALILSNIQNHLSGSTLIVISHRLSTISAFGRILVLSGGRIVEDAGPSSFTSTQVLSSKLFSAVASPSESRVTSDSL